MAIHPESCESTLSNLELFQTPTTHIATDFSKYTEFSSTTAIESSNSIEFQIEGDDSEYLDFSQSFLYLRCKILAKDRKELKKVTSGTDATVPPRSVVFLANLGIAAIFKQVEVYLANQLISNNDTLYSYRAMFETLLSYSKDVKAEFLKSGGYYPETHDLDEHEDVAKADTSGVNQSAVARFNKGKFGKSFELLGRIHTDFMAQPRYLPGKIPVKLKLHRQQPQFFLMSATDTDYILEIENATFYAKFDQITSSIRAAHLSKWQNDTIKYPLRRVKMSYFTSDD